MLAITKPNLNRRSISRIVHDKICVAEMTFFKENTHLAIAAYSNNDTGIPQIKRKKTVLLSQTNPLKTTFLFMKGQNFW